MLIRRVAGIALALAVMIVSLRTARADRVVAVAPLSTFGNEDKSAATKKLLADVEAAIGALPGTKIVTAAQVADAIKKANKPLLKTCEGDAACVAEIGKLVGAQIVVTGEVGGLGDAKVFYLGATDVATAKELRSTTLGVGAADTAGGAAGAAVRLLDPDRYTANVKFSVDVTGATVYVNGSKTALGAGGVISLPVGTQAVRVTQPEYHDFVRFVDVVYGKTTEVAVGMQQYPIVEHDVHARPTNTDKVTYVDPPIWRRWYVWGAAALVTAIVIGVAADHIGHYPDCIEVGTGGACPKR